MTDADINEALDQEGAGRTGYEALERHLKYGVALLSPESADRFAREHPDYAEVIKTPGRKLGSSARSRNSLVGLWHDGLADGAERCRRAVNDARQRLERADRLELVSELVAAASSSALLGLLLEASSDPDKVRVKVATGFVTLLGTWATVISRFMRRVPGGGNLVEHYAKLLELAAKAEAKAAELREWHIADGQPPQRGNQFGDEVRQLAIEITKVCGLVGVT